MQLPADRVLPILFILWPAMRWITAFIANLQCCRPCAWHFAHTGLYYYLQGSISSSVLQMEKLRLCINPPDHSFYSAISFLSFLFFFSVLFSKKSTWKRTYFPSLINEAPNYLLSPNSPIPSNMKSLTLLINKSILFLPYFVFSHTDLHVWNALPFSFCLFKSSLTLLLSSRMCSPLMEAMRTHSTYIILGHIFFFWLLIMHKFPQLNYQHTCFAASTVVKSVSAGDNLRVWIPALSLSGRVISVVPFPHLQTRVDDKSTYLKVLSNSLNEQMHISA